MLVTHHPQTPFIADLKPSGRYVMEDLHKVGGTPGVLKYLLQRNMINGNCMTVTGADGLVVRCLLDLLRMNRLVYAYHCT